MPSKELTNEVANFLRNMSVSSENGGSYVEHECKEKAEELLSTILDALQEPSEDVRIAYYNDSGNFKDDWRAMLNASPLGEKAE